ncbi:aldehyde dehydrogenase family protein (plasmid) [Paraburkholderia sp. D15]|uniref:aldehyde dehydrogenase family protein n=1 Tax=Paraburkholderia sp. D15 TaxID=2880218 RepID=UPI002478AEDB|nr:aldehyde dehydrogenase family protein [Paraburkholderia sp. D15]WGS54938.1 aldehyde dehydrogenase family protein [Paraburkholderia sp. D15]
MKRESHLPLVFKHYLNGSWTTSATTGMSLNPSDLDEPIGEYARSDARMVDAAIDSASAARREWARVGSARRAESLDAIGTEILARRIELARLLAREQGKTLPEAMEETIRAGQVFRFFAVEAVHRTSDCLRAHRGAAAMDVDVSSEPLGVVAVITPWSFPLAIPAAKIAAALSAGNCVVFKPAELVAGCAWALADIISRSGLPAGVFNLLLGSGRVAGARLVANAGVQGVSFTGSTLTARSVLQAGAARRIGVQLETGGNSALIVLNDANLDKAVDVAVASAYGMNGQRYAAASKLIVEHGVRAAFTHALHSRLERLTVDHALKRGADVGPLFDEGRVQCNLDTVARAEERGAQRIHGGRVLERGTRGYFFEPALLLGKAGVPVARDEVFGPIAVVLDADDYAHALHLANETPDGTSSPCSGLCTASLDIAQHFRRHSHSRAVTVNLPTTVAADPPSVDFARDNFFTQPRIVYLAA